MIAVLVACVVDASVGIKLVVTEALSAEAHALFAHLTRDPAAQFAVPRLFDIECANILWKLVQRAALPPADAHQHLAGLLTLRLQRLPVTGLAADALRIACDHGVTAYDARYVAASERLGVPFITADTRLVNRLAGAPFNVLDLAGLTIPPPP
jgi:predicted nucleic acid-binding protein